MSLKLQKFVPIDRDYSIYEIIDEGNEVLMDVSRTDAGVYVLMCHKAAAGRALDLEQVESLVARAKALLAQEEPS